MTLFDVEELTRYWIDHPPLHLMVSAYLGVGKARRRDAASPGVQGVEACSPGANVGQLLAELGPAFTNCDVHTGLHPVVLDFAELRRQTQFRNYGPKL